MKQLTGTFQNLDGTPVAGGRIFLKLSQDAVALNTTQVSSALISFNLDANGSIVANSQFWANDELSPSGTSYAVSVIAAGGGLVWGAENLALVGASPISINTAIPSGSSGVTTPGAVLLNPVGGANQSVSGPLTVTGLTVNGNVTEISGQNQYRAFSFNSILWVDGAKYTSIMAAYADIPATGGCVIVPPNYAETVLADWTLNKKYTSIVFTGPAAVNFGTHIITVTSGTPSVGVYSWNPWGSFVLSDPSGVEFKYTGTGTFVTIGDSTLDTLGFKFSDIAYFLNNAGSAAIAIKAVRCPIGLIERPRIIGPGGAVTQQGIILDGTGNFTGVEIDQPFITGVLKGIQLTGSGVNAGNACQINGGNISAPATGTSLGIDFQAGSGGNIVDGTDVEGHSIGVNLAGTSSGNFIRIRSESNTSGATLGASTTANEVRLINSSDTITDNGTNNVTAATPQNPNYITLNATTFQGRGASTLTIKDGSGANRLNATGNTNLFVNLGGGATLFGSNASPVFSTAGLITNYNQIATAGNGVAVVYGSTSQKSESAADTNVLTFTPPATAGTYRLRFVLDVSAATAATLGWTATWKDSNGTAQTPTNLTLEQAGIAAPALTFVLAAAGVLYGDATISVDNSATNIVIKLTFTGTSFTAKASATIERLI